MKQNMSIGMNRAPSNSKGVTRYSDKYKDVLQRAYKRDQSIKPKQINKQLFFYRIRSIGVGAFSFVYLVSQQNSCTIYAQKSINKKSIAPQLFTQIKMHLSLHHKNIVNLYHIYSQEGYIHLIMDYAGQSLFSLRKNNKLPYIMSEQQIIDILRQLINAVSYLHSKNIVHADIKLQNILYQDGVVKLCDFGYAHINTMNNNINININNNNNNAHNSYNKDNKQNYGHHQHQYSYQHGNQYNNKYPSHNYGNQYQSHNYSHNYNSHSNEYHSYQNNYQHSNYSNNQHNNYSHSNNNISNQHNLNNNVLKQVVGTLQYLDPEYVQGKISQFSRDIWAIGIVAYQLSVGKNPFQSMHENQKWSTILKISHIQSKYLNIPHSIQQFIQHTLCPISQRYSIDKLKNMAIFNKLHINNEISRQRQNYSILQQNQYRILQ